MKVSVVGLGKLGLCTAACFAARGHEVVGMDSNEHLIAALSARRCPIDEKGLPALLREAWDRLTVTSDILKAVQETDFTAIIVPTPSTEQGDFTNVYVEKAIEAMAPALRHSKGFHVVDVVSTVMPGSSETIFKPLLERMTAKRCGVDFGLVYNPEFIALGSVIHNFLNPDMVLIGASDDRSAEMTLELYHQTCDNLPHFAVMSLINAEITKLSINCFCTTKISFANELAMICERTPGADVDVVTAAIGKDTRIGSKYLSGGLGFGGPCFPRDNRAFQVFAEGAGQSAHLAPQVVAINHQTVEHLAALVSGHIKPGDRVAVLGLSYKPDTHIIEESQSIELAVRLADKRYKVCVYDPKALDSARAALGERVSYAQDAYSAAEGADALVMMTRWPEFEALDWTRMAAAANEGAWLIDSWRIYKTAPPEGFRYHGLGLGKARD
jgi:UDPglucose 6-dehydrogenase